MRGLMYLLVAIALPRDSHETQRDMDELLEKIAPSEQDQALSPKGAHVSSEHQFDLRALGPAQISCPVLKTFVSAAKSLYSKRRRSASTQLWEVKQYESQLETARQFLVQAKAHAATHGLKAKLPPGVLSSHMDQILKQSVAEQTLDAEVMIQTSAQVDAVHSAADEDARRGNTPAGQNRPFCGRALSRRFGGQKSKLCAKSGMRRACPQMCTIAAAPSSKSASLNVIAAATTPAQDVKGISLKLKFNCGGWHHSISCTVSCIEEFDGHRGMWVSEKVRGKFAWQLGNAKDWKYVATEPGYAERCKLKDLLGEKCVHHVKKCFTSKSPRICGSGSATSRRIEQNRRKIDADASTWMNWGSHMITQAMYCRIRLNLPPTASIAGKKCPTMPKFDGTVATVTRCENQLSVAFGPMPSPSKHMRQAQAGRAEREKIEADNGNFKLHTCPSHSKVKAAQGKTQGEDAEVMLDHKLRGRPVELQMGNSFGGGCYSQ